MSETLYRLFDGADELLYVGVSLRLAERLSNHSKRSWFADVRRIATEHYPDRPSVLMAEAVAIRTENPRYNILGVSTVYQERHGLIAKVRRELPQDDDVMLLCDELEKLSACQECERRRTQNRERVRRHRSTGIISSEQRAKIERRVNQRADHMFGPEDSVKKLEWIRRDMRREIARLRE
jgi:hypothetical protein